MRITNLALVNIQNILSSVAEKKLPQRISFAIMKKIMELQGSFKCYTDSINKIFESYDSYQPRRKTHSFSYGDIRRKR